MQPSLQAISPSLPSTTPASTKDWAKTVAGIQAGDDAATTELYHHLSRGIRYHLARQLGPQDIEDKLQDTFLIVLTAIRRGEIREPERLMGFVRTVVHRQVAAYIECAVRARHEQANPEDGLFAADRRLNPEQTAIVKQKAEFVQAALSGLSQRDRDILVRFYLLEQTPAQICEDMHLTETQFRLVKSRAKAKFGEIGKKQITPRKSLRTMFA